MTTQNPMHVHPPAADPARSRAASGGRPWTPLHEAPPKPPPKVPVERAAAAQELPGPFLREYRPSWPYRHRSAQVTVVLYYRNRPPRAVGPEGEEGRMQRWFARPYTAFELQLGWHTASFKVELPAKERGRSFPAEVRVRWKVEDPCLVARSQVTDVAALLVPELEQRLRDVSRAHSINDAEDVHDAVQKELRGEGLGGQFGLELDVFVAISWDKLIQDHGANRGQVLHQTDLEELNQKLRQLRDGNQRELISAWAEDFQEAMKRGDHAVMAQMMARNPQDLGEIRQMFRKEQRESRQDVMELMSRLIDGGLLERWELGEQAMVVVEFLRSSARHVTSDPLPQVTVDGESRRKVFWERADGREDTETSEKRGEGDRP